MLDDSLYFWYGVAGRANWRMSRGFSKERAEAGPPGGSRDLLLLRGGHTRSNNLRLCSVKQPRLHEYKRILYMAARSPYLHPSGNLSRKPLVAESCGLAYALPHYAAACIVKPLIASIEADTIAMRKPQVARSIRVAGCRFFDCLPEIGRDQQEGWSGNRREIR